MTNNSCMILYIENEKVCELAEFYSKKYGFILTKSLENNPGVYLSINESGLFLTDGNLKMQGDFSDMLKRLVPNNLNGEMLVRASKIKNLNGTPTAIDATAGMGEDSLLLAASGYEVKLFEYDPVIAALLEDTIKRSETDDRLKNVVNRMSVEWKNSIEYMLENDNAPDLILLDPMFPERSKSGLIKKKFQLIQQLESPCSNEDDLLNAAIKMGPKRIVIKRPAKGPNLAGVKPSYSIMGKAIRYDCIVLNN